MVLNSGTPGTVCAHGGNITLTGPVTGNGVTIIDGGATETVVDLGQGVGTLKLDDSFHFTSPIMHMGADDAIALMDLKFTADTSAAYTANAQGQGGVLTISDGAQSVSIPVQGNFDPSQFVVAADGSGHTLNTHDPLHLHVV